MHGQQLMRKHPSTRPWDGQQRARLLREAPFGEEGGLGFSAVAGWPPVGACDNLRRVGYMEIA